MSTVNQIIDKAQRRRTCFLCLCAMLCIVLVAVQHTSAIAVTAAAAASESKSKSKLAFPVTFGIPSGPGNGFASGMHTLAPAGPEFSVKATTDCASKLQHWGKLAVSDERTRQFFTRCFDDRDVNVQARIAAIRQQLKSDPQIRVEWGKTQNLMLGATPPEPWQLPTKASPQPMDMAPKGPIPQVMPPFPNPLVPAINVPPQVDNNAGA
jgi:hypothetical protein